MSENKDVLMFVDDALTSATSLKGSRLSVVHPTVPVRQHVLRELGVQVNHANAEIGPEEVEVVRYGPHDDEVDVLVAELPGNRSGSSGDGIFFVDCNDDFAVRGKYFAFVISVLEIPVQRVRDREAEHPL